MPGGSQGLASHGGLSTAWTTIPPPHPRASSLLAQPSPLSLTLSLQFLPLSGALPQFPPAESCWDIFQSQASFLRALEPQTRGEGSCLARGRVRCSPPQRVPPILPGVTPEPGLSPEPRWVWPPKHDNRETEPSSPRLVVTGSAGPAFTPVPRIIPRTRAGVTLSAEPGARPEHPRVKPQTTTTQRKPGVAWSQAA